MYNPENIDIDSDGREIYECRDKRYVFAAVTLGDYRKGATVRSEKWKTVHLSAEYYKNCAIRPEELISKKIQL